MGYVIKKENEKQFMDQLLKEYDLYAPVVKEGEGCFSDTGYIGYDKIYSFDEIEWDHKSDYSFKEILTPINETLFYFTEDQMTEPSLPEKKVLIFLRSCDLHAVKRLDQIYLKNGAEDFYYKRRRELVKFALIGCDTTCQSGFCVSMQTNQTDEYDIYMKPVKDGWIIDCKDESLAGAATSFSMEEMDITPDFVTENKEQVTLPKNFPMTASQMISGKNMGAAVLHVAAVTSYVQPVPVLLCRTSSIRTMKM